MTYTMVFVYARHSVGEYESWKETVEADAESRDRIGSLGAEVFRVRDAPDEVVVLLELDDESVEDFVDGDRSAALDELAASGDAPGPEFAVLEKTDELAR